MDETPIEWTDRTINQWIGCTKVSEGCKNCYMFRLEKRFGRDPTKIRPTNWENIERKLKNWTPSMIFGNSMTDMLHEYFDLDDINEMFVRMARYPKHTFQILTKRAHRLPEFCEKYKIPENVWMGVSVELEKYVDRIDYLRESNAKTKFISFEPLLGPIPGVNLKGIDWVIVGGESDLVEPRKMESSWVDTIFDAAKQNLDHKIPFFFKQWGGRRKCDCHKSWGCRVYKEQLWDEMPQ